MSNVFSSLLVKRGRETKRQEKEREREKRFKENER